MNTKVLVLLGILAAIGDTQEPKEEPLGDRIAYRGYGIEKVPTKIKRQGLYREKKPYYIHKLTKDSNACVLELQAWDDGDPIVVDDEREIWAWVQIPDPRSLELPAKLIGQVSYRTSCSIWLYCDEQPVLGSRVTVEEISREGIRAWVSLYFEDWTFQEESFFRWGNPESVDVTRKPGRRKPKH
jgi:hypothetical protein